MKKGLCCCFSGHRNLPKAQTDVIRKTLRDVLDKLIEDGYIAFISGGALGFDMLAAEIVLEKMQKFPFIRLVMALPCKNQSAKWESADKKLYNNILNRASEVIYVCENYCTGCMHLRNKFMVENSDLCVMYKTQSRGGTAYTAERAKEKGISIINIADLL